MCKIVAFSNAAKLPKRTPSAIHNELKGIERDGFGYAVQGESNVFGEKTIAQSYSSRFGKTMISLPFASPQAVTFGNRETVIGPGIFHGRTSTNDKGIGNCHPMQRESWHLIHNGVVTDWGPDYQKVTSNDSEDVLHRLTLGIDQVERHLSGYYAFAAIAPDGRLHMGRDSQAQLFCAFSTDIDSYIFATTADLIKRLSKELKFKLTTAIDKVQDDCYFIMNGNEMVHFQKISPRGWTRTESAHATKSIGRSIDSFEFSSRTGVHNRPAKASAQTFASNVTDHIIVERPNGEIIDATRESKDASRFNDDGVLSREMNEMLDEMDSEAWSDIYNQLNDGYSFYDSAGRVISLEEFHALDWRDQMDINIVKPNGGVLQRHGQRRKA